MDPVRTVYPRSARFVVCWAIAVLLLANISAPAQTQDYNYTVQNGTVAITRYIGRSVVASIPESLDGMPITAIGSGAFQFCTNLASVSIPGSVTRVEDNAFFYCTGLTNIHIGGGVVHIGAQAFSGCTRLGSAEIPNSVTNIGDQAFYYCRNLTNMVLGSGVSFVGSQAFQYCSLTDMVIGGRLKYVGDYAFDGCGGLRHVDFAPDATSIGYMAFHDCSNLSAIAIPDSVTNLAGYAFNNCTNLASISIGSGVSQIGAFSFFGCQSATNITLGNGIVAIGSSAFGLCTGLKSIALPQSVVRIDSGAFGICSSLTNIILPGRLSQIGSNAFDNCTSLTGVTLPDSVTDIASYTFRACDSLASIAIGSGVTNIDGTAFKSCAALSAFAVASQNPVYASEDGLLFSKDKTMLIRCPPGIDRIAAIPANVTSVAAQAFVECAGLNTITVAEQNPVFSGMDGVLFDKRKTILVKYPAGKTGSYTVPESVVSINGQAFQDSVYMTGITIGSGVAHIGAQAFEGCQSLRAINVEKNNPAYSSMDGVLLNKDQTALLRCPAEYSGSFEIPNTVTNIEEYAFYACSKVTRVTIGTGVAGIGRMAFYGCPNLTEVIFKGNNPEKNDITIFWSSYNVTVYYYAGTSGWDKWAGGGAIVLLDPLEPFGWKAENGAITITQYKGIDGAAIVPAAIEGRPVVSISGYAFRNCVRLASVAIPGSVTKIEDYAFTGCRNLSAITVDEQNPAYSSMDGVLFNKSKTALIQCPSRKTGFYRVPDSVVEIGVWAFANCSSLAAAAISKNVASIGLYGFASCYSLKEIYFLGDAPKLDYGVFQSTPATAHYIPGTKGWGSNLGELATAPWNRPLQFGPASLGVLADSFAFTVTGESGQVILVESCTNLANPIWTPAQTNTLTGGVAYFNIPRQSNSQFFRCKTVQ